MAAPAATGVLVVGEALVDRIEREGRLVGEHVGGSPANVAGGLSRLGHPVELATHLGDDERGRWVTGHLAGHGVRLSAGSDRSGATSVATARLDAAGAADYAFDLEWRLGEVPLAGVGHVHTGSIAATVEPGGSQVLSLLERARGAGATVSYDPNARPAIMGAPDQVRARVEDFVRRSDLVRASDEDLAWLYAGAPLSEVMHLWGRSGPGTVVVTRGGAGALVQVGDTEPVMVPAPTVQVVDTVGAGDSFMAGLVSGLLDAGLLGARGGAAALAQAGTDRVLAAVQRGLGCAAVTIARAGAYPPTREELSRR